MHANVPQRAIKIKTIMKKDNFFNFKEENIWDVGFPMSPRKFLIGAFILTPLIVMLVIYCC